MLVTANLGFLHCVRSSSGFHTKMPPIDSCHPKYVLSRSQILSLETRHMLITLQLVMETNMNYALLESYSIQNESGTPTSSIA